MKAGKFLSNYLKAKDVPRPMTVTIRSYAVETVGQGEKAEDKVILYFQELEQGLVMNKTNLKMCTALFGTEEMDEWIGHKVQLASRMTQYQGTPQQGLRLEEPPAQK